MSHALARGLGPLLVLLTLLARPAPARADVMDDIRGLNERAEAAYALGKYADAADQWEKAFSLKPQPAFLFNAAQAQRLGGNKERALLLYENYLRLYGEKAPARKQVLGHMRVLRDAIKADSTAQRAKPTGPTKASLGDGKRGKGKAAGDPGAPIGPDGPEATPDEPTAPGPDKPTLATTSLVVDPLPGPPPDAAAKRRKTIWIVVGVVAAVVVAGAVTGAVLGTAPRDPVPTGGAIEVR